MKGIDAREMTKDNYGYSGSHWPAEWIATDLSLKAGKKIRVWRDGDTVMAMACIGSFGWDAHSYLQVDGSYTRPQSGPGKVCAVIRELGIAFSEYGYSEGLTNYCRGRVICACCGCDLTDPVSRQRGIGPKCITTIHGAAIYGMLQRERGELATV